MWGVFSIHTAFTGFFIVLGAFYTVLEAFHMVLGEFYTVLEAFCISF